MWQVTHSETFEGLRKEAVWAAWSDVDRWHEWDPDLEFARAADGFSAGTRFVLKPKGGPKVTIRLLRAEPLRGYTDLTVFPLARMYGIHDMVETSDGLTLSITIRVEGPLTRLWKTLVAQKVADEAPAQLRSLANWARQLDAQDGSGGGSHGEAATDDVQEGGG
ncbi:MAG TPA: SRPBCC family protein [Vicinamibacterales bacterium]|nr:SRPBCC family protein [Vicinamibacterales bacterium]